MDKYSDGELVIKARNGEESAFEELYQRYQKRLEFVAYKLCNNQEDAKDAVQQTFLQAHKSLSTLREPSRFYHWCCKIIHGKCTDMFRKNRDVLIDMDNNPLLTSMIEERKDFLPDKHYRFRSDQKILLDMINQLPLSQKELILLVYFEQFNMRECAEILNVPEGTVKSRLYTAKRTLKNMIDTYNCTENKSLDFHDAFSSTALIATFNYAWNSYKRALPVSRWKSRQLLHTNGLSVYIAASLGIFAVGGICTYMIYSPSESIKPIIEQKSYITITPKEAYFKLRNWAVDERQMVNRSKADYQTVKEYYTYLKSSNSEYYQVLKDGGWTTVFESMIK